LRLFFEELFANARPTDRSTFESVDTASSQPGELTLSLQSARLGGSAEAPVELSSSVLSTIPLELVQELWLTAAAESYNLTREELATALNTIGTKNNHGLPPETYPDSAQRAAFFRALRLPELALAQACALGREAAWERFLTLYRSPLTQAAIAITGSATRGNDLADSLYSELYGVTEREGHRSSPLASYSGRGSLIGWLRTILVQRHIDHHRRTHRETSLDAYDIPAPPPVLAPLPAEVNRLTQVVSRTLEALVPEERFLLSSYFLDEKTLLQIARLLQVHESTVSRKLKRLTATLRKQILRDLQSGGLSKRAAEEALGTDPRDIELNMRTLLQTCQPDSFSSKTSYAEPD
jgi:RNA polymerase sigma-70 factor (ECF subfamily)